MPYVSLILVRRVISRVVWIRSVVAQPTLAALTDGDVGCVECAPEGGYKAATRHGRYEVAGEARETAGGIGLTLGGAIVIAGIVVAIVWSLLWGVILAIIGLAFFGGFARGRWY